MKGHLLKLKEFSSKPLSVVSLGFLVCALTLLHLLFAQKNLRQVEERALELKQRHLEQQNVTTMEEKFLRKLQVADKDYIEKEIETLKLLTPERERLEALSLSDSSHFPFEERLRFLKGGMNSVRFKQVKTERKGKLQETLLSLEHPVEMDLEDLKRLLSKVTGDQDRPPELVIKKLSLQKKMGAPNEEVFLVDLELIKQELSP